MAKVNVGNIQEVTRNLTLFIEEEVSKQLSQTKLVKASRAGTKEMINQIQKRTQSGIKVDGKRLKSFSRSYKKWKRDYIRSGVPKKGKRKRGASTNARYRDLNNTTKWKAKKLPAHIRLTGKMFSNMQPLKANISRTRNGISITLNAFIRGKRNQKIYSYLVEMDRDFWGLSTNKSRRDKEVNAITEAMFPILGIPQNAIS